MSIPVNASITESWEETFSDLDDWSLSGLICPNGCGQNPISTTPYSGIQLVDGTLAFPNKNSSISIAVHSSNVLYGSWSWDWEVLQSTDFGNTDVFEIISHGHEYNKSGSFWWKGSDYALIANTHEASGSWVGPGFSLWGANGSNNDGLIGSHTLPETITGNHHLEVTRNLSGTFKVYYDGDLIITGTDNSTVTRSEQVTILTFDGHSKFDNISVLDYTEQSTTTGTTTSTEDSTSSSASGFILGLAISSLIILIIIRKKIH